MVAQCPSAAVKCRSWSRRASNLSSSAFNLCNRFRVQALQTWPVVRNPRCFRLSACAVQECSYHLAEVFEIGGPEPFMHWHKERLLTVKNARFNPVFLDERF